jgi:hypothetical protein
MAYEGDNTSNYEADYPEIRRRRSAVAMDQAVSLQIPSQMNPATEITGYDPLLQSANGSRDVKREIQASLEKDKQGLGSGYDYGPKIQSGEFQ